MDDRVSYQEMRSWLFNCYYNYCRVKLMSRKGWITNESETAYAYDQFSTAFDTPIENLMLEVLILILDGGRYPQSSNFHLLKISNILKNTSLGKLLIDVPDEESEEFLQDMKILNLV